VLETFGVLETFEVLETFGVVGEGRPRVRRAGWTNGRSYLSDQIERVQTFVRTRG